MKIDRQTLANKIEATAKEIQFENKLAGSFRAATQHIMQIFGKLGQSLNYQAQIGWLYDMVWHVEEDGLLSNLPLVLECEWNRGPRHRDEVDGDFQKLVQARADVRVWISASPSSAPTHIENCKRQVRLFSGTLPGDNYVFAVYDWTTREPIIEQFVVQQSN
jgi:hypothetical protein